MKNLYINSKLVASAEKIYVTSTAIICSNGISLNGFFDMNTVEIKDDAGNTVQADKTDMQIMQDTIDLLVLNSLGV